MLVAMHFIVYYHFLVHCYQLVGLLLQGGTILARDICALKNGLAAFECIAG